MKKTTILLGLIIFTSLFANAQKGKVTWMSLAVKGGYGSSMMMHMESLNDQNVTYKYFSPSYFVGGRFGLTFGQIVGVSTNVLYSNFMQGYSIDNQTLKYDKQTNFKALDFDVTLRLTSPTSFYFEIGPKFTKINSVTNTIPTSNSSAFIEQDVQENYKPNWTSILLGMGFMPYRSDRVELSLGFRASYGISSIISDNNDYYAVKDALYSPTYTDPTTTPIQLYGVVELNYLFGYFGTANCGKFKVILFK